MADYKYKLADGHTLILEADTTPLPAEVFKAAQDRKVNLAPEVNADLRARIGKTSAALAAKSAQPSQDERRNAGAGRALDINGFAEGSPLLGGLRLYDRMGRQPLERGEARLMQGDISGGVSDVARGAMGMAAPVLLPAAAMTAPAATVAGLVTAPVGTAVGEVGAKALNLTPSQQELAGTIGGIVGGGLGAKAAGTVLPIAGKGLNVVARELGPTHTMAGRLTRFAAEKAGNALSSLEPNAPVAPSPTVGARLVKPADPIAQMLQEVRGPVPAEAPTGVELPPAPEITPGGRLMGAPAAEGDSLGRSISYTSGNPGTGAVDRPLPVQVGPRPGQPPDLMPGTIPTTPVEPQIHNLPPGSAAVIERMAAQGRPIVTDTAWQRSTTPLGRTTAWAQEMAARGERAPTMPVEAPGEPSAAMEQYRAALRASRGQAAPRGTVAGSPWADTASDIQSVLRKAQVAPVSDSETGAAISAAVNPTPPSIPPNGESPAAQLARQLAGRGAVSDADMTAAAAENAATSTRRASTRPSRARIPEDAPEMVATRQMLQQTGMSAAEALAKVRENPALNPAERQSLISVLTQIGR